MTFKEKFDEYFRTHNLGDEWVYSNFSDYILKDLSPENAFSLISEVVDFLLAQSDEFLRTEMLELIGAIAGKTNTTEIPIGLLSKLDLIEKLVENDGNYTKSQLDDLKRWYRL